jgi:peptide deformylase
MALMPILRYPDAQLRQKCADVTAFDENLRKLVADMADTMYAANGAGLAAIQVGQPLRMFIIEPEVAGLAQNEPVVVFCNPEILEISEEAQTGD